jgi:hypothetical protein
MRRNILCGAHPINVFWRASARLLRFPDNAGKANDCLLTVDISVNAVYPSSTLIGS